MIKFTYALKLVNSFVNWKVHFPALESCCLSSEIGETKGYCSNMMLGVESLCECRNFANQWQQVGRNSRILKDNRTIASRETLCSHLIQYTLSRWSFPVILKIQGSQAWKSSLWWVSKLLKKCQNWKKKMKAVHCQLIYTSF